MSVWEFKVIEPESQWLLLTRNESAMLGERVVHRSELH